MCLCVCVCLSLSFSPLLNLAVVIILFPQERKSRNFVLSSPKIPIGRFFMITMVTLLMLLVHDPFISRAAMFTEPSLPFHEKNLPECWNQSQSTSLRVYVCVCLSPFLSVFNYISCTPISSALLFFFCYLRSCLSFFLRLNCHKQKSRKLLLSLFEVNFPIWFLVFSSWCAPL